MYKNEPILSIFKVHIQIQMTDIICQKEFKISKSNIYGDLSII